MFNIKAVIAKTSIRITLPYFEFVYDEHWDLGHGWSGDMPGSR